MKTGWIRLLVIICSVILILNLARSSYSLWQKGGIITEQQALKARLEKENQDLKQKLDKSQSNEFIEQQARNKLNLQKEGEVVVIIPKTQADNKPSPIPKPKPNWELWRDLFF